MTLLSDEYKELLETTHAKSKGEWGSTAWRRVMDIRDYAIKDGAIGHMLDYGSAGGKLKDIMDKRDLLPDVQIIEYDPGYPDKADNNTPCDFVACIDVLEHIEPDHLEAVLEDLHRCMIRRGLFDICMRAARCKLADGSQAHLIIENQDWWKERLEKWFTIVEERVINGDTYRVYVAPKET